MLKVSAQLIAEIEQHAEREYPHECCGLLIGRIVDDGRTREVVELYAVANTYAEAERHHRMQIPPLAYAQAERRYAKSGLGVVGNYHSHPDHPAVPSQFDLAHLAPWPTMSYIVVSVHQGRAVELRSWELAADRSRFNEEEIGKGV
jgi:proteasome lid subunit RPN8/RPN11